MEVRFDGRVSSRSREIAGKLLNPRGKKVNAIDTRGRTAIFFKVITLVWGRGERRKQKAKDLVQRAREWARLVDGSPGQICDYYPALP